VAISVRDGYGEHVLRVIGRPDLIDESLSPDDFDAVVTDWTQTRAASEIVDVLSAQHVSTELVRTSDRMYDVPQLDARNYYQEVEHPITGPHRYPGWPFRITPGPVDHHRLPPPTLGQHNEEVLRGLGLTDDEIEDLRARKVIGERALNA
jgi:crotonobetainyl-CoA:carnitine CoA-transferase CaiB-like acyl-CoA transferase